MDKSEERKTIQVLIDRLQNLEIIKENEQPDFILRRSTDDSLVGIEVTQYYPHQDQKNRSVVKKEGSISDEGKLLLFDKTELGYFRFVPAIDVDDFQKKVLRRKEEKLDKYYKTLHPECCEFWLLVELSFYDNIQFDELKVKTKFDRLFFLEEPNRISEIRKV